MRFWFSPLPLSGALISELAAAGLEPWPNDQGIPHGDTCLLVYDSPERHIAAAAETKTEGVAVISSAALAEGYSHILGCREASGQPLLAGWRLQRVGGLGLQHWLAGKCPSGMVGDAEPIKALVASVILSMLDTQPRLLDAYNDLELQAELIGSEADLNYRERLDHAIGQADPLPQLLAALQNREGELGQARHEAESTLQQLHRVQEELRQLALADEQKQHQLDTRTKELHSLQENIQAQRQELRQKVDSLEKQLQNCEEQLEETRDDAELTLVQLHQVHEEKEKLLVADIQNKQLLDSRAQEMQRLEENIQALQQELQPKVDNLEEQLQTREKQLQDTREDAELTMLQLQQVQEELERLVLADRQNQQLLDIRNHELHGLQANIQAMQQELQPKVDNLEEQLQTREKQLQETREDAEFTMLQLQQVQEELERLVLADRQNQQLLDIRNHELHGLQANIQAMQQELQPKVDNLEEQLQTREKQLQDTREDAELTMLQLQQVQEELKRYFLQACAGSQLMEAQTDQLQRAKRILAKVAMNDSRPGRAWTPVAVEVLPATAKTNQQPSLQVQALLKSYTNSLDRASELLTRAMRR